MKKRPHSILKYLLVVLFLTALGLACDQQSSTVDESLNQEQKRNFLPPTNWYPDTIFTGETRPVEFEEFDLDTLPKPKIIPLSKDAQKVKAYSNTYPVIPQKVSVVPSELTPVVLSEEGSPIYSEVSFRKEVVPAKFPEPVKAPRPFMKEDARFNIQSLNLDNGALDKITMVTKDLNSNLWIGTQENGVSCYDGNYITTFRVGEGLNSNNVASVLVDTKGNIWLLSAWEVLTKFDGETFTHYYLEGFKNVGGAGLFSMLEDKNGNIWMVFTGSGALVQYRPGKGKRVESFTQYPIDRDLYEVFEDSKGYLWIGTDQGALRFDGQYFFQLGQKEGLSDKRIFTMQEDIHGNIWISGGEGLYKYEYGSERKRDKISGPHHFEGIEFLIGPLIEMDKKGNLWCAFQLEGGIGRFNMDRSGEVVSLSYFGEEEGLTNNRTQTFMQQTDWTGNVWIGTKAGGLNFYGKNQFQFIGKKEGLKTDLVSAIKEDIKGDLWFSSFQFSGISEGVNRYDGKEFTYISRKEGLITNSIIDILPMENGDVWFGSGAGGGNIGILFSINSSNEEMFTNFYPARYGGFLDRPIWSLEKDEKGRIWTNYYSRFELNRSGIPFKFRKYDLHLRTWKEVAEDPKGNIWFGVPQVGALRLDPHNNIYTIYSKNEGLSASVEPMLQDSRGNMWFGTLGDGLKYIDRESFESGQIQIKTFKDPYGFLDEYIVTLQEDHNKNIWISARNGVGVLVPPSNEESSGNYSSISDYTYYHFGKDEGLKSYTFSNKAVCLDQNNQLWWGTQKGAVKLDLDQFELPEIPPQNVRLSHLALDNQFIDFRSLRDTSYQHTFSFGKQLSTSFDSVSLSDNYPINLSLPFRLNHLTFYFSAQDWAAPNQIRYSYMMEGLDDDWSEPQEENRLEFRNIPAGKHVLKVKAIGAARKWSEVFEYPFTIRPPWWQTVWAYLGYALVIGLLGYWLYQFLLNRQFELQETKRLKELDDVKTKMYTNISHEFRTPLTVISGMSDKIRENPRKWAMEGTNLIKRNSKHLLGLVNQILDLRKLESGTLKVHYLQADIVSYLQYLAQSFQSLAEDKDIQLHFYSEEKELFMDFDPDKLQNIFTNLLSNAIKYTKEGGNVYVSVSKVEGRRSKMDRSKWEAATPLEPVPPRREGRGAEVAKSRASHSLSIKVRDTGIGIPEVQLPHIFDRFYQVDDSSTRKGEHLGQKTSVFSDGTGIGLALTKELVQLLKGDISVKSEINKGTEFTIRLPVSNEAQVVENIQPAEDIEPISSAAVLGSLSKSIPGGTSSASLALIIEDNADVAKYLFSCMEENYQLLWAKNGQQGVDMAFETTPDIIISDVMMPVKDGFEVCQELKQNVRTSHIPIILLTAKADINSKLEGLSHGADAYLSKPFNPEELNIRLQKLIELRQQLQNHYSQYAPGDDNTQNLEEEFLTQLRSTIQANLANEYFGVQQLSRAMAMSRSQLFRKIKALTNKSTSSYIRTIRLTKARELLKTTDLHVSEIAYEVGFSSPVYFTQVFSEEFGVPPSEMR